MSGTVYASDESLYVVATGYFSPWGWEEMSIDMSQIYKFSLEDDDVSLAATGIVPGHPLNQFSMDEYEGYFRIATTSWGSDLSNNVFVLEQTDDDGEAGGDRLDIVGNLTGIGISESLYGARFMEDRGFLVTFRMTDPLFTLDLSTPWNPRLVGTLEMPGYSAYLHPMGDDYLIGLGRDADPQTGAVRGLQLSLFDVSDLANPVRKDVYLFSQDVWGAHSEAEWDHHAFAFYPSQGIVALPVSADWAGNDGLEVISVNKDSGFAHLGTIVHDTPVRRSLRIEDCLYSVSLSTVKVNAMPDVENEIASLIYAEPE
jgi:uncharacterized secreted protein with C-terminal beta-propeller domain